MEYLKIKYFEKTDLQRYREFIISQNNCILCGTVLSLKHIADRATGEIKEEAYCPQCEIKTRAKIHILN